MNLYYFCIFLLATLTLCLGLLVSIGRGVFGQFIGHSNAPNDTLHKWVRAHANCTEYVPISMVLIYLVSLNPVDSWVFWCVILLTLCRFIFVAGILIPSTMAKPNPMRFVGAMGTLLFGLGLSAAFLLQLLQD